jgi:hypothetical protein
MIITKKAQDLKAGDVINPPAHERGWLKSKLTVIELKPANPDKRGPWLSIKTSYPSPYGNGQKISEGVFNFRPETAVKVFAEGESKPDAPKGARTEVFFDGRGSKDAWVNAKTGLTVEVCRDARAWLADHPEYVEVPKPAAPQASPLLDRVLAKAKQIDRAFGDDVQVKHAIIQGVKQGPAFDAMVEAAELGLRNEILRNALSECSAREQDRARMTVEAIQVNRADAKSFREEIQENCRKIRAALKLVSEVR